MPRDPHLPPIKRYEQLQPKLREFLESMDDEDIRQFQEIMARYKAASTISKFMKWLVVTIFMVVMGLWALGEKIAKLLSVSAKSGGGM